MSEKKSAPTMLDRLQVIGSEMALGALIALLAIGAATASYLSAMSDSDQTKYNIWANQKLTNANADYLAANQVMSMDYNNYDAFYLNQDKPELSEYYTYNFSEELTAAVERSKADANEDADPFDDQYYSDLTDDYELSFKEAKALFALAEDFNTRGDAFQLVVLIASMGLAFAAWGALLPEGSKLRLIFSVLSIGLLIYAAVLWLQIPAPPVLSMAIRPD